MAIIHIIYSPDSILPGLINKFDVGSMPTKQIVKEINRFRSNGHTVFLVTR